MTESVWRDDEIVLRVGTTQARRLTQYRIESSVFRQPGAFTARFGAADLFPEIWTQPFPGARFELMIASAESQTGPKIQTGLVDAYSFSSDGPSELELRGRDFTALLFDSYFLSDRVFSESSYYDITAQALALVGIDAAALVTGTGARDKVVSGWTKATAKKPSVDARTVIVEQVEGGKSRIVYNTIKADIGNNLFGWLKEQYRRAGLFLWSSPTGKLILSAPNVSMMPQFKIERKVGQTSSETNIIRWNKSIDFSQLHSEIFVYGRSGGGKDGRRRIVGHTINEYLVELGLTSRISYEEDVRTQREATHMALRYAADEMRNGITLEYTVSGHTAESQISKGVRLPWSIDELVHVDDELLGINGDYYVGDVTFERGPSGTTTTLRLYRPQDLKFAEKVS